MSPYADKEKCITELWKAEVNNIPLYGYGIKAFTLDMIHSAIKLTKNNITTEQIKTILGIAKKMLTSPITLLEGAEETLKTLSSRYKIVVATKGDLLEQENKIEKSGLTKYLHHIEVMSEKDKEGYALLMKQLCVEPNEFLMVGNSIKSDILPVLELGAQAIYIPSSLTWFYEDGAVKQIKSDRFLQLSKISEMLNIL